jgi:hypothetical protein
VSTWCGSGEDMHELEGFLDKTSRAPEVAYRNTASGSSFNVTSSGELPHCSDSARSTWVQEQLAHCRRRCSVLWAQVPIAHARHPQKNLTSPKGQVRRLVAGRHGGRGVLIGERIQHMPAAAARDDCGVPGAAQVQQRCVTKSQPAYQPARQSGLEHPRGAVRWPRQLLQEALHMATVKMRTKLHEPAGAHSCVSKVAGWSEGMTREG